MLGVVIPELPLSYLDKGGSLVSSMPSVDRHDRGTFWVHKVTTTMGGWNWLSDCLDHFSWSCWQMRHSRSLGHNFFFLFWGYTGSRGLSTRVSSKRLLVSVITQRCLRYVLSPTHWAITAHATLRKEKKKEDITSTTGSTL